MFAYFWRFRRTVAAAAIATMITAAAIATYTSTESPPVGLGALVGEAVVVGVVGGGVIGALVGVSVTAGDAVGASSTPTAVCACEGQKAFEPAKVAMTVYLPGTRGFHMRLYMPFASVVVCPTS